MKKKIFVICLPFLSALVSLITYHFYMKYIAVLNIPCLLFAITGLMCPACGGTRSLKAFLNGDILASFNFNPIIIISVVLLTIFYIQLVFNTFGVKKKIVPKSIFFKLLLGTLILYYIVRNLIKL